MDKYCRYDQIAVGDVFPADPVIFPVTETVVADFLRATGNDEANYRGSPSWRRAPSMIASVYLIELLSTRRSPPGGIHAKQTVKFHRAIQIGESLAIQAEVVEKYIRRERPYVVSGFKVRGQDGSLVASGRVTTIWGRES